MNKQCKPAAQNAASKTMENSAKFAGCSLKKSQNSWRDFYKFTEISQTQTPM